MWPFRRKPRANLSGPVDDALWDAVRRLVKEETQSPQSKGHARVIEERGPESEGVQGSIRIVPNDPAAAPIGMSISDDTITFSPGRSGAGFEIWSSADPEWDSTLRKLIRCVRDGRYSERVKRGRVFSLKVRMRFEGVLDGGGQPYTATYASLPHPEHEVAAGSYVYPPW